MCFKIRKKIKHPESLYSVKSVYGTEPKVNLVHSKIKTIWKWNLTCVENWSRGNRNAIENLIELRVKQRSGTAWSTVEKSRYVIPASRNHITMTSEASSLVGDFWAILQPPAEGTCFNGTSQPHPEKKHKEFKKIKSLWNRVWLTHTQKSTPQSSVKAEKRGLEKGFSQQNQ